MSCPQFQSLGFTSCISFTNKFGPQFQSLGFVSLLSFTNNFCRLFQSLGFASLPSPNIFVHSFSHQVFPLTILQSLCFASLLSFTNNCCRLFQSLGVVSLLSFSNNFCRQFQPLGFTSLISFTKKFASTVLVIRCCFLTFLHQQFLVHSFSHQVLFSYFPSPKLFGPQLQSLGFVSLLSFTNIVWYIVLVIRFCLTFLHHKVCVHCFSHSVLFPYFPSPKFWSLGFTSSISFTNNFGPQFQSLGFVSLLSFTNNFCRPFQSLDFASLPSPKIFVHTFSHQVLLP